MSRKFVIYFIVFLCSRDYIQQGQVRFPFFRIFLYQSFLETGGATMPILKYRRFSGALMCLWLLVFTSACSYQASAASTSPDGQVVARTSPTTMPATITPTLTTSPGCPTQGTGKPAVMPALLLGADQNIVYFSHASGQAQFKRYDVQTGKTTTILNQDNETIQTAQLSTNGQWILFTALVNNISEIQLARIDGQDLQILYCAPSGQQVDPTHTTGMQWSPDGKQILFVQGPDISTDAPLYALQLSSGSVQQMVVPGNGDLPLMPRTWIDDTRLYVSSGNSLIGAGASKLLIFDTSKGSNQPTSMLQQVQGTGDSNNFGWDFDSNYNATQLFITNYQGTLAAGPNATCQISVLPITGGTGHVILTSKLVRASNLRVIGKNSTSLLLVVNQPGDSDNGLWKMNTDGSGLIQLASVAGPGGAAPLNAFSQYPWANVSRDESLYTQGQVFGSLNGGPTTQYTSDNSASLVGWTTM
jgi:dipeptidyl aminopeptidase/acylaminoacyl peptidase